MEVLFTADLPDPREHFALFDSVGFNERYHVTASDLSRATRSSWAVVSAYSGQRLVGFGRVVSDGVLYATIHDMIVAPGFRDQGIGSEILVRLVDRCRSAGIHDIQLFCAQGKESFYRRHGFLPRPGDAPGMQLARSTADS